MSLSTQSNRDSKEVKVLALCADPKDKDQDGSLLLVLILSVRNLTGRLLEKINSLLIIYHFKGILIIGLKLAIVKLKLSENSLYRQHNKRDLDHS